MRKTTIPTPTEDAEQIALMQWAEMQSGKYPQLKMLFHIPNGGAENVPYTPMACPDEGEFTGWKKCKSDRIVKLKIPEDARRSSASRRKCRCDKAEVIEITSIDGKEKYTEAVSGRDADFVYKVGEMVSVDDFCKNRWEECAAGIHFFMNRKEAVDYWL